MALEAFDFTTTNGDRLDLIGSLTSYSDEIQTGAVEKRVVRRDGALHQFVGAPPRQYSFSCVIAGRDAQQRYERLCAVIRFAPEGRLTHPRFGSLRAVCLSISAQESPGDALDTITVLLKFAETGLSDPPKPAPTAEAAAGASQAQNCAAICATESSAIAEVGAALQSASNGFAVAIQNAEAGLGVLPDVDASLAVIAQHQASLQTLGASFAAQRAATLAVASALRARSRFQAGRPPLIWFEVPASTSLGTLCQRLYGGRGLTEKAQILRLNRIARPYSIPAGTRLLLTDPSYVPLSRA